MSWTRVNDGKPEDQQQVWLYMVFDDGEVTNGYGIYDAATDDFFIDIDNCELIGRLYAYQYGCEIARITHWMSLPENPTNN